METCLQSRNEFNYFFLLDFNKMWDKTVSILYLCRIQLNFFTFLGCISVWIISLEHLPRQFSPKNWLQFDISIDLDIRFHYRIPSNLLPFYRLAFVFASKVDNFVLLYHPIRNAVEEKKEYLNKILWKIVKKCILYIFFVRFTRFIKIR